MRRILKILTKRGIGKTMCPSEALPPRFRKNKIKMAEVRRVGVALAKKRKIEIVQRGKRVDLAGWRGPVRFRFPLSAAAFPYEGIDFRKEPKHYRVARGEQGVLSVEPYKSELLPLWRFRDPGIARKSAAALFRKFRGYRAAGDFVGMDMTRKFLQMGVTRSRRYANHKSGRKYVGAVPIGMRGRSGAHGRAVAPLEHDSTKAECAEIFRAYLQRVEVDRLYVQLRSEWKVRLG